MSEKILDLEVTRQWERETSIYIYYNYNGMKYDKKMKCNMKNTETHKVDI